ncbi:MAG: glycoside hydrolase family 78 protein [Acetatifactor sp.]|nr:glycoside hydrolase family 78 protein [Acetatifactor sp.]
MRIYDFRVEYRKNPIGITEKHPRFSWKLDSETKDTVQKTYHILVKTEGQVVWDEYEQSENSILIPYNGKPLCAETAYDVEVEVTDNYGNYAKAQALFETGMIDSLAFKADMISHDFPEEETACPIFYHTFITRKAVKRARIYITARGVYEAYLNGNRIGEDHMAPGWTSYHKRLQYQIYDITSMLSEKNEIEIVVGDGWYKGPLGFVMKEKIYGGRTGVFAEAHIWYEDGSREVVCTNDEWKVRTGEIRYSEIYMGEIIDTTVGMENGSCEDSQICYGRVWGMDFDRTTLTAQENEPVRITERIPGKKLIITPKGEKVIDFGQNLTGAEEVHINGKKGQKIVIRHAETLDKDGNFCPATLRLAKSTDVFICNGKEQVFLPHFTFHGFRYICVEGVDEITPDQFTACVMHSDMEKTGDFACSDKKVNQLQSNIAWGQRDNFLDIPTDCPQRDERLGWTGDAQVFSWTAAFNRNTALFFRKWMRDMTADSSLEKGVPYIVPDILGKYSAAAWSDAAVIMPWVVYQVYGDKRVLEESWKCMHEWVDYIRKQCGKNGLWQSGFQYGDWLAMDKEVFGGQTGATDQYLIANAYFLYVTDLVRQTAEILHMAAEAGNYRKLYEDTLCAFRREYYTETGRIVSETQTGAVLSLYFNLAREEDRERILHTLVSNIQKHKNHLTTGFVGTPYLCHTLSDNGYHELAATLFMNEDTPSWLYAVNMGATTIWERWNSILPDGSFQGDDMNSLNHYAYGSIGDWMYRKIAGVSQMEPGYKKFKVQPMFVKGIEEAGIWFESVYGKIESKWSRKDGKIRGYVRVPANTMAEIHLPEKEDVFRVGSGIYKYEYASRIK